MLFWSWDVWSSRTSLRGPNRQAVGTAQNAVGSLLIVRKDGIQKHCGVRDQCHWYEFDVLKTELDDQAQLLVYGAIHVYVNGGTEVMVLSCWE